MWWQCGVTRHQLYQPSCIWYEEEKGSPFKKAITEMMSSMARQVRPAVKKLKI